MKRRGYLVTYAEKIRRNPRLAEAYRQFYGAPDVWYWEIGGDKAKIAAELKRMGFENMLFQYIRRRDLGNWVTPEEVREVAKIPGVLQSEYDIFRDTMEPEMLDKIDAVRPTGTGRTTTTVSRMPGGSVICLTPSRVRRRCIFLRVPSSSVRRTALRRA